MCALRPQCSPQYDMGYLLDTIKCMLRLVGALQQPSALTSTLPEHQALELLLGRPSKLSLDPSDPAAITLPLLTQEQQLARAALLAHRLARWAACVMLSLEVGAACAATSGGLTKAASANLAVVKSAVKEVMVQCLPMLQHPAARQTQLWGDGPDDMAEVLKKVVDDSGKVGVLAATVRRLARPIILVQLGGEMAVLNTALILGMFGEHSKRWRGKRCWFCSAQDLQQRFVVAAQV